MQENSGRMSAEQIVPGETMSMLAERICARVAECGIGIEPKDIGAILAGYAATGSVRIKNRPGLKPVATQWLSIMLSLFFGEQQNMGQITNSKQFIPADDGTPEWEQTEVEINQIGSVSFSSQYGISKETFRGILRETEDEFFLSEENWRKVDALVRELKEHFGTEVGNYEIRCMERLSSTLIATGTKEAEALDFALGRIILPYVSKNNENLSLTEFRNIMAKCFPGVPLPFCKDIMNLI